jgi:hypothetical protein
MARNTTVTYAAVMSAPPTTPPKFLRVVVGSTAAVLVAIVIAVYTMAMSRGHMPPSHPWSGITLLLLAGQFAIFAATSRPNWVSVGLGIAVGVLVITGAETGPVTPNQRSRPRESRSRLVNALALGARPTGARLLRTRSTS